MLSISLQIIFGTGRIIAESCSGVLLLEPPNNGAVDVDCATLSTISGANAPTSGNVSIRVDNRYYEDCSAPYISGNNITGITINVECPGKML